ncbi:porin [Burkholderia sp. MR1-5-21]
MKKFIGFGVMVLACTAHAQSSVTLYGIVDAGLTYTSSSGGRPLLAMTSGNQGSDRWGLRGTDDLGDGFRTIFTLEGGFSIVNGAIGQGSTFFGRQAFVGIASDSWGTLTLGRQYASANTAVGPFESGGDWAAPGATFGSHPGDLDNLDNTNRVNNSIKFQSPNYGGAAFSGFYSFGGQAGQFSRNQVYSLSATYASGPIAVAVGYLNARDPNFSLWGTKSTDSATASNMKNPVFSGYASAATQEVIAAAGSYTIDKLKVALVYSNTRFDNLGANAISGLAAKQTAYRGNAAFNTGELNLKYQLTPALLLGAAYFYTRGNGPDGKASVHYQQVNLGIDYFLSKLTDLYLIGVRQYASGTDSTGASAVAAISGTTASRSNTQTLVTAGIRHSF